MTSPVYPCVAYGTPLHDKWTYKGGEMTYWKCVNNLMGYCGGKPDGKGKVAAPQPGGTTCSRDWRTCKHYGVEPQNVETV